LPKTLAVLATLLLAVLAGSAGASPAAAHGDHTRQISTSTSGSVFSSQSAEIWRLNRAKTSDEKLPELPDRHGKSDTCCGTIMCHAGVTPTVDLFSSLHLTGARVTPTPSSGQAQRNASGLERPPRTTYIA
jgi:hypothetical protein